MKKEKILLIMIITVVLIGGGFWGINWGSQDNEMSTDEKVYSIKTISGDCTGQEEQVKNFLKDSESGNTVSLNITMSNTEVGGKSSAKFQQSVVYDGEDYIYQNEVTSIKYSLFYSVTSSFPNSETQQTMYILANERYSIEQIAWSYLSSQKEDQLDFVTVCSANPLSRIH